MISAFKQSKAPSYVNNLHTPNRVLRDVSDLAMRFYETVSHITTVTTSVVKWEVAGSIQGWFIPNTLKHEVMAARFSAHGCGGSITIDWLVSG